LSRSCWSSPAHATWPSVHQLVEAPALQPDVPQPPAEQIGPLAEVVADPDRGDLLDQIPFHVVEVHQFRHQPARGLGPRLGGQELHLWV
jgi:hypothetical protein